MSRCGGEADYPAAEQVCQAAVAAAEKEAQNTPLHAMTLNNLAELYRAQGHYAQAEPLFKRALAMQEHTLGPVHPLTKAARESLVDIRAKMRSNGGP